MSEITTAEKQILEDAADRVEEIFNNEFAEWLIKHPKFAQKGMAFQDSVRAICYSFFLKGVQLRAVKSIIDEL